MKRRIVRLFQLDGAVNLDLWKLLFMVAGGLAGFGLTAAGYYVRTQAHKAASSKFEQAQQAASSKFEELTEKLMIKIDGLRDGLAAVNVSLGRNDERHESHTREIARLNERVTRLEDRK